MSDLMEYYFQNGIPAHSKENDFAKPVYVNPVSEDKMTPFLGKVGELAKLEGSRLKDMLVAPFESAVKIGSAINDPLVRQEYFNSPEKLTNDMMNVAAPSSIGNKSYGLGAINLEGFFSPLTRAFESRKVGKSPLSPKMSGNQMLDTLKAGGIKDDELAFTGVKSVLSNSIGEKQVGKKLGGLKNLAEKNALGFERKDLPGDYHSYSLFGNDDETFKTALYKLKDTGFEESHFGQDVVAHRRFGDKDVFTTPFLQEKAAAGTGVDFKAALANDKRWESRLNSLHLDEVQSQFYEKGSKFGHGEPKVPFNATDAREWEKGNFKGLSASAQKDYTRITELLRERNIDTSSPQGFAKSLINTNEEQKIYSKYDKNSGMYNNEVKDAPLRGEKYVELLAKDHLRDAVKNGKDAVSWTTSDIQHQRYYGKDALGGFTWELSIPGNKVSPQLDLISPSGKAIPVSSIEDMNKNIGAEATKKIIEEMQTGAVSGAVEGNAKDVYKKLYDRAIPKAFEKLTGEKPRTGFVKDRNGNDIEIQWVPLDKAKEKMVVNPTKEGNFKELEKSLISHPHEEFDIRGPKTLQDIEEYILQSKKNMEEGNLTSSKTYPKILDDLKRIKEFKEKHLPIIKDLPIASAEQSAKDFFEV